MADEKDAKEPKDTESKTKSGAKSKKGAEDKLDDMADKFSHAMSEGVKKMEDAFDRASASIKDNPPVTTDKIKGFFSTASGAGVLIIVGLIWFLYTIDFFSTWIFPILLTAFGVFLLYRQKRD